MLAKSLPNWLMSRYSALWKKYKNGKFRFEEAMQTLGESNPKTLSAVLSELKKHGWLKVELDPESSRRRLYQLKPPQVAIEEIALEYIKVKGAKE